MELCEWLLGALAAVGVFSVRQTVELAKANEVVRAGEERLVRELERARDAALDRVRMLEGPDP